MPHTNTKSRGRPPRQDRCFDDTEVVKSGAKDAEMMVRGFLTTDCDYFDAHQERKLTLTMAEAGS